MKSMHLNRINNTAIKLSDIASIKCLALILVLYSYSATVARANADGAALIPLIVCVEDPQGEGIEGAKVEVVDVRSSFINMLFENQQSALKMAATTDKLGMCLRHTPFYFGLTNGEEEQFGGRAKLRVSAPNFVTSTIVIDPRGKNHSEFFLVNVRLKPVKKNTGIP